MSTRKGKKTYDIRYDLWSDIGYMDMVNGGQAISAYLIVAPPE